MEQGASPRVTVLLRDRTSGVGHRIRGDLPYYPMRSSSTKLRATDTFSLQPSEFLTSVSERDDERQARYLKLSELRRSGGEHLCACDDRDNPLLVEYSIRHEDTRRTSVL